MSQRKKHPAKWKAKEMLHNPPHGKPLSDKQRKYFAWLAHKQMGGEVDPNGYLESNMHNYSDQKTIPGNQITTEGMAFPIYANGQPLMPNTGEYTFPGVSEVHEQPMFSQMGQFRTGYYQIGGEARMSPNTLGTDERVFNTDLINYAVASGMNPLDTRQGRILQGRGLTPGNQELITYLQMFNQRKDLKGLTPEQRIDAFYNQNPNTPTLKQQIQQSRSLGYGPQEFFRNAPDVETQNLIKGITALRMGGKYRYGCI